MLGGMQDWDLRVSALLDHAAREHGAREIVSRAADGTETRTDWAGIRHDAVRMAQALRRLGIGKADRVGTLGMNHSRHLATWWGATGAGGVLHTINPRLFDDQLEYIANHAEDRVLLYDAAFQPLVDRLRPRWTTIAHYVCFDGPAPDAVGFDEWIAAEDGDAVWEPGGERDPCMLCYTSGTTGHPKGVLYEHRSTLLHAMAVSLPDALALRSRSCVLPVVPMFHAANWGLSWAGAMVGAKFVFSASNEAAVLLDLMRREKVTLVAGVPTVWLTLLQHLEATGGTLPPIEHAVSGGSALPAAVIEAVMRTGARVTHAWGMTETSPVATTSVEPPGWDELDFAAQVAAKVPQGRALFPIQLRAVDLDDPHMVVPRDGTSAGALQVRGPWAVKRYFKAHKDAMHDDAEQWFDTGDVATIGPDGTVRLTDRTKDVIKSGGEWISSVELENAAVAHPAVAEAAAIGMPHPRWGERPILVVVRKPGMDVSGAELCAFLAGHVAKWWLPDAVEFVDAIPHTGTGKISKKDLREQFRDYVLPEASVRIA
ncbi:MAG: long-chain fatty acid--CoA ligase [Novosphingobium sp.]|nr:long-chain fatty acid--CoA ligase [Novosphingobium sp.]